MFAPSRGRELKYLPIVPVPVGVVRPLAGAGIEMAMETMNERIKAVRPLAGAGIEIAVACWRLSMMWVRPLTGAGIEIPA